MTTHRLILPATMVVISVLLAGCVPAGDGATISYTGSMNESNSTFEMDGYIYVGGGITDQDLFQDITVTLYHQNGSVISTTEIGDLSKGSELDVNIKSNKSPYYIVFKSPDFWRDDITVKYYVYDENDYYEDVDYIQEDAISKEDLPI